MSEARDWDYLIKFLIIGDSAVGKTAMLLRYTDNTFTDDFISTIGVDFKVKKMERNGKKLKIQVWDTGLFSFLFFC
jgi:small GTP-binding protein